MGISLWIVPPQSERELLQKFMDNPPVKLPPGLRLPSFQPHITLGTFDSTTPVEDLKASVPRTTSALNIVFESVDFSDHYFRSVFVKIKLSEELARLHKHVHNTLGLAENTPIFPHMSLFYIADEFSTDRQALREQLADSGHVTLTDGGTSISVSAHETGTTLQGFEATEVWIVQCDGPVETWNVLDTVSLL